MASNDIGTLLSDYLGQFAEGGGVDLADCAVGAICAQTDVETANFVLNIDKNFPIELRKIGAELQIVEENNTNKYGYKVGVDANNVVHYYKGEPIEKIFNIWNYGTGNGNIPRTRFWSKAITKLKKKYDRANERFMDILDERYEGHASHAPNNGKDITSKIAHYKAHINDYLTSDELSNVSKIKTGTYRLD